MTDEQFDALLASALAPPERPGDRRFVARVQARIELEDRLDAQRRLLVGGLVKQILALLAIAAGAVWLGRAASVANFFAQSPATGLAVLLTIFAFLALVVVPRGAGPALRV